MSNWDKVRELAMAYDITGRVGQSCIVFGPDGWAHAGELVAVTRDYLVLIKVARIHSDGRHHELMAGRVPANAEVEPWPVDTHAYISVGGSTVGFAPLTLPLSVQ